MLPTIKELRASAGGLAGLTDEEIVGAVYPQFQRYYKDPDAFAGAMGYEGAGRGLTGSRMSAGIDSYQGNLYGVAEAVSGEDWARRGRERNESAAQYANQRSKDLGGIDSYEDVDGVGAGFNYAGGLLAQSFPYVIEAGMGGAVARGLSVGARAAGSAAREMGMSAVEKAAAKQVATRSAVGGAAASYPSAVGDILSNQREQLRANGQDDSNVRPGMAALGAIPYAAANYFSPLERVASGGGLPRLAKALDSTPGLKGGALRLGANGAIMGAAGAGEETFQELMNQRFGRMVVDPNETMTSPGAMSRYAESAVGGGVLGGMAGGAMGGWNRSEKWYEDQAKAQQAASLESGQQADLLDTGAVMPQGPMAQGALFAGEASTSAPTQSFGYQQQTDVPPGWQITPGKEQEYIPPRNEGELAQLVKARVLSPIAERDGQTANLMSGVHGLDLNGRYVELTGDELTNNRTPIGEGTPGYAQYPETLDFTETPRSQWEGGSASNLAPDTGAPFEPNPASRGVGDIQQDQQQQPPTQDSQLSAPVPTEFLGRVSPKAQVLLPLIDSLEQEGHLDHSSAIQATTLVGTSKFAAAKKIIDAALKDKAAADAILTKAQQVYAKSHDLNKPSEPTQTTTTTQEAPKQEQAAVEAPPIKIGPQRGKGGVVTLKVAGRTVIVKPLHWNRTKALLGLDEQGLPTLQPQTMQQVADAEGISGPQARTTIAHSLSLFGLDAAKINTILSQGEGWMGGAKPEEESDGTARANAAPHKTSDTEAFAHSAEAGNVGARIEDSAARAANGNPIIDDGRYKRADDRGNTYTTDEDRLAKKQADALAKAGAVDDNGDAYDPAKDKALPANKTRVRKDAEADINRLKSSPQHFKEVAAEWDNRKSDGTLDFGKLDVVAQFRWLNGLLDLAKSREQTDAKLNELQREVERTYAQDGRTAGENQAVSEKPAAPHDAGTGQGRSRSREAGTTTESASAQVAQTSQANEVGQAERLSPPAQFSKPELTAAEQQKAKKLTHDIQRYEQLLACLRR